MKPIHILVAFCFDLHSLDARKRGETERRLYAVAVWRESNFFTPRERAALAWTEADSAKPMPRMGTTPNSAPSSASASGWT